MVVKILAKRKYRTKNVYRVSATLRGERITTNKFWLKKKNAQSYADLTNKFSRRAFARVVRASR